MARMLVLLDVKAPTNSSEQANLAGIPFISDLSRVEKVNPYDQLVTKLLDLYERMDQEGAGASVYDYCAVCSFDPYLLL